MSIEEKIETIAKNVPEVYEAGKQAEYDRFWDEYQENGNRTSYFNAFSGHAWTNENFKPKYDITVENGYGLFWQSNITGDLDELLEKCNVKLDFSKCFSFQNAFNSIKISIIGTIDARNVSTLSNTFLQTMGSTYQYPKTIKLLILKEDGTNLFSNTFGNCQGLKNITIEGTIGNDFDIHWSPLSKNSILSIFNALSDSTTNRLLSLSLSAVNSAFETSSGAVDGSVSEEWEQLKNSKSNWIINLM